VAGIADGAGEVVTVNGVSIPLNTNMIDVSTTVNGVNVTIDYDATTGEITIVPTDGVTPLDDTALTAIVAGVAFENTDPSPTPGGKCG